MKPQKFPILTIIIITSLISFSCADRVYRNAQNKTTSEVNKKVNKKIGDVFNGKKEKKPKASEPKDDTKIATKNEPVQEPDESTKNPANKKPAEEKLNTNSSDFVPGTIVIFEDSLKGEQVGEFPSKWDLQNGTIEVMQMGTSQVIGFRTTGIIFPYLESESYLPEKFTLEFDAYFYNQGNEGYTIKFPGSTSFRVNNDGIKYAGQTPVRAGAKQGKGWRHIELSFNKRALKVYYNGVRLANIPRIKEQPKKVTFSALVPGSSKGRYAMIKNIRIAEGAVPLYDRLKTEGKLIFNNIQFDYNKATLKAESLPIIAEIAQLMKDHPELKFSVEGHTDSDGPEVFNQSLSEQRALAVKTALVNQQIDSAKLQIKGWGESDPIDKNTTVEGKAKNRRVEFIMLK